MPVLGKKADFILSLFFKCEKYKTLPYPGGVLSQPAWIMRMFDVIEETRERVSKEKQNIEDAKNRLKPHG